ETCEQKKGPQRKTKFCSTWKNWKSGSLPACWAAAIRRRPPTRRTIRATEALLDPAGLGRLFGQRPVGSRGRRGIVFRLAESATSFQALLLTLPRAKQAA